MQRQYILNRKLNLIHKNEQNNYLREKIKRAKSLVNLNCPESFKFFKNEFHEGQSKDKCKSSIFINIQKNIKITLFR